MKKISLYLSSCFIFPAFLFAQTQHFTFTANTGDSYSIVVSGATLDGNPLAAGDEIGVFTPAGLCVGASLWSGSTPLALTAWADDPQTQGVVDGYAASETMSFRIWQQSSDVEFSAAPTYTQGNGLFGSGAFAQLTLTAVSGGEPSGLLVTNTNDSGDGSLRAAITAANTAAGPDTILFNIPQSDAVYSSATGTWTIQPTSALPAISDSGLVIDGASQAAFIGSDSNPDGPEIVINGELAGNSANGFLVNSSFNVVSTLVLNGFANSGIFFNGDHAHHNRVSGCYVGTNATGDSAVPNNSGIYVSLADFNIIGGTDPAQSNLVSGNKRQGILVGYGTADHNVIIGNFVGTVAGGDAALPNGDIGIVASGLYNKIGGATEAERNVISGNKLDGVRISGSQNIIMGNYIGTDVTGSAAIGNGWDGIALYGPRNVVGGAGQGEGNIISGNQQIGIGFSDADSNEVVGNSIGTDKAGNPLGNVFSGISLSSGSSKNIIGPSNIISYNGIGVFVNLDSTIQNTFTQNSITHNIGLGISSVNGGNGELPAPSNIQVGGGTVFGNAPAGATVEIFSDDEDEGKIYEGTTTADASGNFQWNGTPTGPFVTATATDAEGNTSQFSVPVNITSVEETASLTLPQEFSLGQNYPNPFNPLTKIQFALPLRSKVTLKVYNLLGRAVLTLTDGDMPAGIHTLLFDGEQLTSGIYFYRLQATNAHNARTFTQTRKLTLLK